MEKLGICCLAVWVLAWGAPAANFYYGRAGEAGFVAAVEQPQFAEIKADLLLRAGQMTDPAGRYYLDPANLEKSIRSHISKSWGWPRLAGRILAGQAETLGPAAAITGDASPLRHGADVLLAFADLFALDSDRMKGEGGLTFGEFNRGLAMAYSFFAPAMTDAERAKAAAFCRSYVEAALAEAEVPAWFYPYSNWLGVSVGGAGMIALALEEDYPAEAAGWIERCRSLLNDYLDSSFGADGEFAEHGYINYAMVNVIPFAEGLAARGDSSLLRHPHLKASIDWLAFDSMPGGSQLEPRNDSEYGRPGDNRVCATPWLSLMAREYQDGRALWLWKQHLKENVGNDFPLVQWEHSDSRGLSPLSVIWSAPGVDPVAPAQKPAHRFYQRRGLALWRSGFTKEDFFFSIECGQPFPTTHDQADGNNFNLYCDGVAWATDAGYGNKKKLTDRSQGRAHSVVQIEGKSQALSGAGMTCGGKTLAAEDLPGYGYFLGDATEEYNFSITRLPDSLETEKGSQASAAGSERVLRHAVVVKGRDGIRPYVVLFDDVQQDGAEHSFVWQMLTEKEHGVQADGHRLQLNSGKRQMSLYAFAQADGAWSSSAVTFGDGREPESFQKVQYSVTAVSPRFVTVLLPGHEETRVSCRMANGVQTVEVVHADGRTDRFEWAGGKMRPVVQLQAAGFWSKVRSWRRGSR
jgi:hypothetical protein